MLANIDRKESSLEFPGAEGVSITEISANDVSAEDVSTFDFLSDCKISSSTGKSSSVKIVGTGVDSRSG